MIVVRRTAGLLKTLLLLAAVAVLLLLLASRLPGWQVQTVLSGSMEPGIGVGGVVVVAPVDSAEIGVGDVITYQDRDAGVMVTHRVVALDGQAFVTRGDANGADDPDPVPVDAVQGRVVLDLPHLGRVANLLHGPGRLLMGLGALLLAYSLSGLVRWPVRHPSRAAGVEPSA